MIARPYVSSLMFAYVFVSAVQIDGSREVVPELYL